MSTPEYDFGLDESTKDEKRKLDDGLAEIDKLPLIRRSIGLIQLQKELDYSPKQFDRLISLLAKANEEKPPEGFAALVKYAMERQTSPVIDNFLSQGLTVVAGDGATGKTSLTFQLGEAVSIGSKFADQFQTTQADVVVVELDETYLDSGKKFLQMGLAPDPERIHFMWSFSPMAFPELRRKVQETNAKVVIIDSLLRAAGGEIKTSDAEFGLLIYRLNDLAAELGVAIIVIHHITKSKDRRNNEPTKEDIYGSAYVFNGTADAWLFWRTKEDGEVDDTYFLKRIKDRSGTVEVGTVYQFSGSSEDRRLSFKGIRDRTVSLDQITTDRERVKQFLLTHEPAKYTAKQVHHHNPGLSLGYCKNLLAELHGESLSVIRREKVSGGVGRPSYAYFAVTGKGDKGAKVTNSAPLSTGLTPPENSSDSSSSQGCLLNKTQTLRLPQPYIGGEDDPHWPKRREVI